jgi:hypothetical protein
MQTPEQIRRHHRGDKDHLKSLILRGGQPTDLLVQAIERSKVYIRTVLVASKRLEAGNNPPSGLSTPPDPAHAPTEMTLSGPQTAVDGE